MYVAPMALWVGDAAVPLLCHRPFGRAPFGVARSCLGRAAERTVTLGREAFP